MRTNYRLILLGIFLLALFIRLPHLFDKEQGTDESLSIKNAEIAYNIHSVYAIPDFFLHFYQYSPHEVNPPLFFFLIGMSLHLYHSLTTLKILLVTTGILTLLIFYLLARTLFPRNFALFATFFYAINPFHIILSQHIRAYIFLILLFQLFLYSLYQFLIKKKHHSLYFLILTGTAAIYTHYYACLFIASAGLVVLLFSLLTKNRTIFLHYFAANILIGILAIPALLLLKKQATHLYNGQLPLLTPKFILYPLYKLSLAADVSTVLTQFPYLLILFPLSILLALYGIISLYKKDRPLCFFTTINFCFPYLILTLFGFFFPIFLFRYLLFLLPLYILLISFGLWNIPNTLLRNSLCALIILCWLRIILFYYSITTTYHWPLAIAI